ncbi:MAG: hypothetical protein HY908_19485 [Myxococcales bacterium]|nr:hypothetical protein [Myxococcales bacterium]
MPAGYGAYAVPGPAGVGSSGGPPQASYPLPTAGAHAPAAAAPPAAPAPAAPPGGGSVSVYDSVARYAALCAALAVFPERRASARLEYGIADDAAHAALDDVWQERFEEDPQQLAKWEQFVASFRASLERAR